MKMPFKGKNRVTQVFSQSHGGIDVVGDDDKTVFSISDGVVDLIQVWDGKTKTGSQSYGNLVRIKTSEGVRIYYAHLSRILVKSGQTVKNGDEIGIMGNTGNSFGEHLHLEARSALSTASRINPESICALKNAKGTYTENVTSEISAHYEKSLAAGSEITLENTPLYVSSTAKNQACKKSGKFYIYSEEIIADRIRITCSKEYVGKTPIGNYVTGWVNVNEIK